jgi:predicted nucleic acid-binding protein
VTVAYLDTSALVKLVVAEPETRALLTWLRRSSAGMDLTTSALGRVELIRAARRHSPAAVAAAEELMTGISKVTMTPEVLADAAMLSAAALRTLHAIHLATARRIGGSLTAFLVYDARLRLAAEAAGLPVVAPT